MNALTQTDQHPVTPETLEKVLGTGDLAGLTPQQRVEYMVKACQSIGLNPLTRPFRFLSFQGQVQMYATKDCADQLRASRKISLHVVDKAFDSGVFSVTVRAKTPDGREDEDIGAVALGQQQGESRANQVMKALTKAKRRVTLSICGLGFMDESEVEALPGARTFDADAPVVPMPSEQPPKRLTIREWLDQFEQECTAAKTLAEATAICDREDVLRASEALPPAGQARFQKVRQAMLDRVYKEPEDAELPAAADT
jgi:hypothetical protein